MKRKAEPDPAREVDSFGSSAANMVKRRRGGQPAPKTGGEAHAPQVVKRGRGRPPSEKTLRKRQVKAGQAAEAAAATSEPAQSSPLIHPGPSVDDQVRRLQQEDAVAGNGLRRRRSSSMDRLYGIPEQKAPTGSRLRSASTADPEDCEDLQQYSTEHLPGQEHQQLLGVQAALDAEELTEAKEQVLERKEGVSVDADIRDATNAAARQPSSTPAPFVLPEADRLQQQLARVAAERALPTSGGADTENTDTDTEEHTGTRAAATERKPADMLAEPPSGRHLDTSVQAMDISNADAGQAAAGGEHAHAYSQSSAGEPASSGPAAAPAQADDTPTQQPDPLSSMPAAPRAGVKAASAPVTPTAAAPEQDLEAPDTKAAAFAAMGSASASHRPSSAPTRRLEQKSSLAITPAEQAPCKKGSPTPAQQASPEGSPAAVPAQEASPKGSPASFSKKRRSPPSASICIPLRKAAELNGGSSPGAKRARHSSPEPAAALPAEAKAAAASPAARAKAAKLSKRTKEPSKLQLNSVQRRRLTRSGASAGAQPSSASPPQQPDLAQPPREVAEKSAQPQPLNGSPAEALPSKEHAPAAQAAQIRADEPIQAHRETEQPAHEAAHSASSGFPALKAADSKTGQPPVAAVKADKRGGGPMAYLFDKPKGDSPKVTAISVPRLIAATDHRLSRLTNSSQESVLTGVTRKVEESPEAEQERRQLQKQQEQERKAREHQKVLKQIEAGLDRASTGSSFIRDMTVLVLDPSAQGLEPRIVRGILERVEQDADVPHSAASSAASEASSRRKVALLYVLDSALKSGKARELKLKEQDPGIVKSMQRFCNAVAAGLPALLRATQNDPACYDKTVKVFQVWLDRGVFAKKILEPHLEQLKSHPVTAPLAGKPDELMEPAQLDDFGLKLADDEDSSDEGGWGDDDAAPTLKELPKLPQVEEAHRAPWQRSGGTDRAVGVAPDSPEGSPWHQGASPSFSLHGDAYPGAAGRLSGGETPPFEEKAARAPWHQPAPADRPVQNGAHLPGQPPVCAQPHLQPLYPHQLASAPYPLHQPMAPPHAQSQAPPGSWQHRPPMTGPAGASAHYMSGPGAFPQAQRHGSLPVPPFALPPRPIAMLAPGHGPQTPVMAGMQGFALPPRQPGGLPQLNLYLGYDRHGSVPAPFPPEDPSFMPPLPPDEPNPPLPDEAPPPLPDEEPPPPSMPDQAPSYVHQSRPDEGPLPEDDFDVEMADAAHPYISQQPILYQQPAYTYRQDF